VDHHPAPAGVRALRCLSAITPCGRQQAHRHVRPRSRATALPQRLAAARARARAPTWRFPGWLCRTAGAAVGLSALRGFRRGLVVDGCLAHRGRERARQLDAELLAEGRGGKDAGPAHPEPGERRRHDAEPGAGGKDRHADGRRDRAPRSRSRSRSRSPRHHSSKRPRRYSRSPSPRERRPPRGKDGGRDRNLPPPPPPPPLADKPEQFGVYRGRVSNVMEFGCFVELLGLRSKAEGLVRLANIAKTRRGPAYPLVRV